MATINQLIKNPKSKVFRRAYIKRRLATTGLFEDDWIEISEDIKKWGKVATVSDAIRVNKFTPKNVKTLVSNYYGKYNSEDDESSLWYGYANQQRTLLKLEAGFKNSTLGSDGIWTTQYLPTDPSVFVGLISGELKVTNKNDLLLTSKPLTQILKDYPARNVVGFNPLGMTASEFVTLLRDQTDGAGSFIFRPFFGNTTTNWIITNTVDTYADLNTATAKGVYDKTCWEIIEKLSESENYVPYVNRQGQFVFGPNAVTSSTPSFEFFGAGTFNSEYGKTIKQVKSSGKKFSNYYSRVELKFIDDDTISSTVIKETAFQVSGDNDAWNLGMRTLKIENFWIPDTATADALATNIFNNVSSLKNEIKFVTSFVPHIDLMSNIQITHDSSEINPLTLWDNNDWDVMEWSKDEGSAIQYNSAEANTLSVTIDLDKLECNFTGREI